MKKLYLFAALTTLASCGTQKLFVNVENINDVRTVKNNPIVYSLPKTVVSVKVTAVNEISVKGSYANYALQYLGTDDVITENASSWYIGDTEISTFPVKDSARTFVVESNYPCKINFTPEGFIESINSTTD